MEAKILSLNCGEPTEMRWNDKVVLSSMLRTPVSGPLTVHKTHIDGNSFGSPTLHGVEHAVLYALGMKSALKFVNSLGRDFYTPGSVGENITLDELDEAEISTGDVFLFGEVLAQATLPRIPCGKVNIRMQDPHGQSAMQKCGRSGVYFRVLKPGKIHKADIVKRVELAKHRISIAEIYSMVVNGIAPTTAQYDTLAANGAVPLRQLEKWKK